jgi:iron-sulfur cluster assembly protein
MFPFCFCRKADKTADDKNTRQAIENYRLNIYPPRGTALAMKQPSTPGRIAMINLTPAAVKAVQRFIRGSETPVAGLRLMISGGGCSGLQYGMKLEAEKADDDWELEIEGVKLLVDPMTMPMIDNVTVDFVDTLTHTGFKFDNPNASAQCSCGSSFSV